MNTATCFSSSIFVLIKSCRPTKPEFPSVLRTANRYLGREWEFFKINICIYSPSRKTTSPYSSFWGGRVQSTCTLPFPAVKPGELGTRAHNWRLYQGNITRNSFLQHSKCYHPASDTLHSLRHVGLNCRTLLDEPDVILCVFCLH